MKKIVLLFTISCAGALNGMEPITEQGHYVGMGMTDLPAEIRGLIIAYLKTYDNLDDVVNAIKATSLSNKELNKIINEIYLGNLKKFTTLVSLLEKKFKDSPKYHSRLSRKDIAQKFNTPVAKEYIELGAQLLNKAVYTSPYPDESTVKFVKTLIDKGADPNYSTGPIIDKSIIDGVYWLLTNYYHDNKHQKEILKLLLDAGATPDADFIQNVEEAAKKYGGEFHTELFNLLKKYYTKK